MTKIEATAFIHKCIFEIVGVGFHPDTDFQDYHQFVDGKYVRSFTLRETRKLNLMLREAFDVLGDEIYDISLETANAE